MIENSFDMVVLLSIYQYRWRWWDVSIGKQMFLISVVRLEQRYMKSVVDLECFSKVEGEYN